MHIKVQKPFEFCVIVLTIATAFSVINLPQQCYAAELSVATMVL